MNNPLFYIFSFITIFGCLVYNEIIIIRICNLNYNTRKEIINRQKEDINNNNNDDSDEEIKVEKSTYSDL